MWVFKKKREKQNQVLRLKARWVVFGNHQIKGLEYNDTHALVSTMDGSTILFAIAVHLRLKVFQYDVVNDFLTGDMGDVVYSRQVTGFKHLTQLHHVSPGLYGSVTST